MESEKLEPSALTIEGLPRAVRQLLEEVRDLKKLFLSQNLIMPPEPDQWFDLNELVAYDPEKRSKATFYGYIHTLAIPFHKNGKKLIFLKSEIDIWLKAGRRKTVSEIDVESERYLKENRGNGK